jgi:DNA/RNA endonuclease YhcR with UshA esterase domain
MKAGYSLMLGALTLIAASAGAHHSTAGIYDQTREVEVKGKVKNWQFINPHPRLKIEVVDEKGVAHEWDVSYGGSAVSHLKRRGYSSTTFKPGDVVIIKGHPTVLKEAHGLLIENGNPTHADGKPYP